MFKSGWSGFELQSAVVYQSQPVSNRSPRESSSHHDQLSVDEGQISTSNEQRAKTRKRQIALLTIPPLFNIHLRVRSRNGIIPYCIWAALPQANHRIIATGSVEAHLILATNRNRFSFQVRKDLTNSNLTLTMVLLYGSCQRLGPIVAERSV